MRISGRELARKREERASRFLVTGGTGFLGSHLVAVLIESGYEVIVPARPSNGTSAARRVGRLMDWHGVGAGRRKRLRILEADIGRPGLGLDASVREGLASGTDEIIHCASDTSFAERKRAEVEAANIGGLRNVLDLAEASGCGRLHLISTAYVAGAGGGLCAEALVRPDAFTNVYEETKCLAEWMAWERCREAGIRLNIVRPSVVCGDSRTGRSLLFNAVYYPVRTALFLKDVFARDIRERGGHRAAAMGVEIGRGGVVRMPIRIEVREGAGIDIVPVDYFVRAFLAILEGAEEGGVFHIVNGRLKGLDDLVAYAQRLFGLEGIEACPEGAMAGSPRNPLEVLFDGTLEAYGPYMRDTRIFATGAARAFLESRRIACPEFDFGLFSKCMTYAVDHGWGARLFPPAPSPADGAPGDPGEGRT